MTEKAFIVRKGLGVNTSTATVTVHIAANDAVLLPVGNTGDRPAVSNGYIRYNSETVGFEGVVNNAWGAIGGGGAAGGGYYKGNAGAVGNVSNANSLFRINGNTMSNSITIAAGENAQSTGPLTVGTGNTLTISTGGRVSII